MTSDLREEQPIVVRKFFICNWSLLTRFARHILQPMHQTGKSDFSVRGNLKNTFLSIMRFAFIIFLAAWTCVGWAALGADNPLVVQIWPGRPPDESGNIGPER